MDIETARRLALSLPETVEQDHHGMPSFRIRGKIFATVPDDAHVRIFVAESAVHEAVAEFPQVCAEVRWGAKISGVVVTLASADPGLVEEFLTDAWAARAPRALVRAHLGDA